MNVFSRIWFWLMLLSIIGLLALIIIFETYNNGSKEQFSSTLPAWFYAVLAVSFFLFLLSLLFYAWDSATYKNRMNLTVTADDYTEKKKVTVVPMEKINKDKKIIAPMIPSDKGQQAFGAAGMIQGSIDLNSLAPTVEDNINKKFNPAKPCPK